MHPDLKEVIESARAVRRGVNERTLGVKEGNTINSADGNVLSAHNIDLRRTMFEAHMGGTIAAAERAAPAVDAANSKLIESAAA